MSIRAIDAHSVHHISSGQVVIDLQTAVKELVENSLDAGATSIEVRFQHYGLKTIEVVDNGSGIAPKDHDSIALKHYTSKLSSFEDLSRVLTFGFRGEALSSLCALCDGFTVTTATCSEAPMGTVIEMDRNGKMRSKGKIARQRGTTVTVSNLFKPLPVRRKELERNAKREFQKALNLLHSYALVPCALENKGVRLTVSNQTEGGSRKVVQFKTDGSPSIRISVLAVWGSKALENIVDLDLSFDVETERSVMKRVDPNNDISIVTPVKVQGLISKFAVGAGRTSVDRQFFFVNGRPYNPGKVQKAINEVYRTFNINQSPFVIANVILPTNACDINVSPDKRTIFLHSENNLVQALKVRRCISQTWFVSSHACSHRPHSKRRFRHPDRRMM
ncbi:DNA mismatch repair protein MutL [Boletus edulis]|nr:DNA mismatch repair protein MutL [Boletus edulis]